MLDVYLTHVMLIFFYADDSVLMAPSVKGPQQLIKLCVKYASDYELTFNTKKPKVMCFEPKCMK